MKKEMTAKFKTFIENEKFVDGSPKYKKEITLKDDEKVNIVIDTENFDGMKLRKEYRIFHSTSGDLLFKTYDYNDFEKTYYNELQKLVDIRKEYIMKTVFGKWNKTLDFTIYMLYNMYIK